jgi:hypothetical protein
MTRIGLLAIAAALALATVGAGLVVALRKSTAEPDSEPLRAVSEPPTPDGATPPPGQIWFDDATATSGIDFVHHDGSTGQKYLVEPVSAGLALFDYDGDGLTDIYFLSGAPLSPAPANPSVTNRLYRNEGHWRFRDVTEESGVGDPGFGLGVAAGDYDNDGDLDLLVANFGHDVLYRNNGDGTFTDVSQEAGLRREFRVGAGAAWFDRDGDGDLDLLLATYTQFRLDQHLPRTIDGFPCYAGPLDYKPAASLLFDNRGDGTFADISAAAGIASAAGNGMGVISVDYDQDGDADLFVLNDEMPNFLFENDGKGNFQEVGLLRGFAFSALGKPLGNMGVDCADYDNDGWLDLFVTTYSNEMPTLFRNRRGLFEDATLPAGAGTTTLPHVKWGTGFADFDHDGRRDLFIALGHLDEEVHRWRPATTYRVKNQLLRNLPSGRFADISAECGPGLSVNESSRGTGLDDLDNDGDVDVVVLNIATAPTILRNNTRSNQHWSQIQLVGAASNRDGAGARVRVTAGGTTQWAEVHLGRGYQSHHGTRLHFGLKQAEIIDRIEVLWPGGGQDSFANVPANQILQIVQGAKQPRALAAPTNNEAAH